MSALTVSTVLCPIAHCLHACFCAHCSRSHIHQSNCICLCLSLFYSRPDLWLFSWPWSGASPPGQPHPGRSPHQTPGTCSPALHTLQGKVPAPVWQRVGAWAAGAFVRAQCPVGGAHLFILDNNWHQLSLPPPSQLGVNHCTCYAESAVCNCKLLHVSRSVQMRDDSSSLTVLNDWQLFCFLLPELKSCLSDSQILYPWQTVL